MKRDDLRIPEPCDADWDAMSGDDRKRFCLSCTKHVHNLSEMDRHEAKELLSNTSNLCVQYASGSDGEIYFKDSTNPVWRLHRQVEGAKRLLAAALLIPLAAACDAPEQSPNAVSPVILINPDGTIKTPNPGAGLAPTMVKTPTTPPVETLRGEPDTIEPIVGELPSHDPQEVIKETGELIEEPEPHNEVKILTGDVAYLPAEDSDAKDTACDQPSEGKTAESTHDTTDTTVKHPKIETPHIRRGRVAPSHQIKKTAGKPVIKKEALDEQ